MKLKTFQIIIIVLLLFMSHTVFASNNLQSLKLQTLSHNQAKLIFNFKQIIQSKPLLFTMSDPDRIVLDFGDTTDALAQKPSIHSNLVKKIQTVESHDRLRTIITLTKSVNYQLKPSGKQITIILTKANQTSAIQKTSQVTIINRVDFRNGEEKDSGKIILNVSTNNVQSKVNATNKRLVLTLKNSKLPVKFAHQYDVSDFKTPAKSINLYQKGKNVQLVMNANSKFEKAIYQLNGQFIIDIFPLGRAHSSGIHKFQGNRISLNFQNIPVRSVLKVLAEFTDSNIIISDAVKGNITLHLQHVPWDQALNIILKTQGLIKRKVGNILMIAPAGNLTAQDKLQMKAEEELKNLGPLKTETFHIKYGKAETYYKTLTNANNTLLSSRGTVILNKRTNMLFVKDTEEKLNAIKHYIDKTDIAVKQVEIEARIVTVDKSFEQQLGIKWTAQSRGARAGSTFNLDLKAKEIGDFNPGTLAMSTMAKDTAIGLELSALEAEGGGEILSSPRLLTADQQEALIEQGTEIPYQQASSSGATTTAFKKAVLSLKVTPQITPDDKILLKLDVTQNSQGADVGSGNIPTINTRHVNTSVLVDNGETVVLGGIYERTKTHNITRVPFISSVPILGELFKHKSTDSTRKELLIFVTPRIVNEKLTV